MSTFLDLTQIDARGYHEEGDPENARPVSVNANTIRSVTPRRNNKPGARLTFVDGGGFAVTESYSDVMRYIRDGIVPERREPIALVSNSGELAN